LLSVEKCFSVGHREEYNIYISRYPRDGLAAVYRYISNVPKEDTVRVYAVGGAGIAFDCLNGLAEFPNAELALIPYGNGNDHVGSFGAENTRLFRDIKLMSKAPTVQTDLILCDDKYALSSCSIGIEAAAVQPFHSITDRLFSKSLRKYVPLFYKLGAVKTLLNGSQAKMNYTLTVDKEDISGKYLLMNIGNIALNAGGNIPNPLANPTDGQLDAVFCKCCNPLSALRMLQGYTKGRYAEYPKYIFHKRFTELTCESEHPMSIILDAEPFYAYNVHIKILHNAVKIVSPNGIPYADFSAVAGSSLHYAANI